MPRPLPGLPLDAPRCPAHLPAGMEQLLARRGFIRQRFGCPPHQPGLVRPAQTLASKLGLEKAHAVLERTEQTLSLIDRNVHVRLALENLMLDLPRAALIEGYFLLPLCSLCFAFPR